MPQPTHIQLALTETSGYSVNADGTGGTPADGGAIGRWTDASGNGYHAPKNGSPTLPALYRASAFGGMPMVDFNGVNGTLAIPAGTLHTVQASGAWTVMVCGQVDSGWTSANGSFFAQYDGSSQRWAFGNLIGGGGVSYANFANGRTARDLRAGEFFVACFTWDSTIPTGGVANGLQRGYVNGGGKGALSESLTGASTDVPTTLGGLANNFFMWPGKVGAAYVWDIALSPGDVYRGTADLYTRFGQTIPAVNCVCHGNSYVGQPLVGFFVESIAAELGVDVDTVHNLGWGGSTAADLVADKVNLASIFGALPGSGPKKIGVIYSGTNDVLAGASTALANLSTFSSYLKANGCQFLIECTLTPFHATTSTDMTVYRPAFNSGLVSGYSGYSDYLADIASDPVIGVNGVQLDASHYQADQIHPLEFGGFDLMSPYISAGVAKALAAAKRRRSFSGYRIGSRGPS